MKHWILCTIGTNECWSQISANSCHFWNNISFASNFASIFRVMRHNSSVVLTKILCTVRSLLKHDLVKFYMSSRKSEFLHFDGLLWSKSCTVSAKKVQKSYLSRLWGLIQNLKKNSLFVWMTWEIWWILTRAVKNLKICTLTEYFFQKYVCLS